VPQSDNNIYNNAGTTAFTNAGTVTKSVTKGTTYIQAPFTNAGTVSVQTGTLEFDGGGSFGGTISGAGTAAFGSGGTDVINAGATLSVANILVDGAELQIAPSLSYSGKFSESSGDLNLAAGSTFTTSAATLSGGTIDGAGTLITGGATSVTGYYFTFGATAWTNSGTLTISANIYGTALGVAGNSWANTGTIIGNSDTITFDGNWTTPGTVSIKNSSLTFNGTFKAGVLDQLSGKGDTLAYGANAVVDNTGHTIKVGSSSNPLGTTSIGFTIENGIINDSSGLLNWNNGTLQNVTYQGPLNLTQYGEGLSIVGGLTATGSAGTGAGTINVTAGYAYLGFSGTQTLDNATLNIGNNSYYDQIYGPELGATLTLGKNLTIKTAGAVWLSNTGGAITNLGTITAGSNGSYLMIDPQSFRNQGSITLSNGDTLVLGSDNKGYSPTGFAFTNAATGAITINTGTTADLGASDSTSTNAGTITATSATVNFAGTWTNTGTLNITKSTVSLDGIFTGAAFLALLETKGDTVNDSGFVYNNAGQTLSVGTGTALGTLPFNFTIEGGTIADVGKGFAFNNGALDGVIYQGTLNMSATNAELNIFDGLTLTGAGGAGNGLLLDTGQGSDIGFYGAQTFDNATITLGSVSSGNLSYIDFNDNDGGAGGALTLGTNLTINSIGNSSLYFDDPTASIVNLGTINAGSSGSYFAIQGAAGVFTNDGNIVISNGDAFDDQSSSAFTNAGTISVASGGSLNIDAPSFSNTGTISVAAGGTIDVDPTAFSNTGTIIVSGGSTIDFQNYVTTGQLGTISAAAGTVEIDGALDNTGATLTVGDGTALGSVKLKGTITGGVIADSGNGILFGDSTLSGVTYQGALSVGDNTQVVIANGLTVTGANGNGPGTINLTGNSSVLSFLPSETIDNATINFGGSNATSYMDFYSNGLTVTFGNNLNIVANASNSSVFMGGYYGYSGTFVNNGTITAAASSGQFYVYGPDTFTNSGKIVVSNGDTFNIQSTAFTNLSGTTLTGGSYEADANSAIELNNNLKIVTLDATVILSGAGSQIQSYNTTFNAQRGLDTYLATIGSTGVFELLGGRSMTRTNVAFSNSGKFVLGGGTFTTGTLTEATGSSLFGYGMVAATIANAGTIEASGGSLILLNSVTGTGQLKIDAGSALSLSASVASTQSVLFNGSGAILNLSLPAGFTNAMSGIAAGDEIDLLKTAANAVVLNGSNQLVVTNNGAVVATFNLTGGNGNLDFSTQTDNNGGTFVVVSADQAPVTTAPATLFDNAGVTAALAGLSVADGDALAYNETTTVVLSDATGLLSATASAGATVAGAGTTSLTLSGSLAAVNTELASLTYTGASSNAPQTDTIDVATNDGRGGSDDHKITVTVDQPPATTVPGSQKIVTGIVTPIAGLSVADPDAVSLGQTITVTLSDAVGLLSATAAGAATVAGAGTTSLTLSGDLADVNAELASLTYDAPTAGAPLTDSIAVATNDGAGGSNNQVIAVSLDQPPVTTAPASLSVVTAVTTTIAGVSIADGDAIAAGQTITIVLTDKTGLLSATAETGATVTGSGTKSLTLSGTLTGVDAELATLAYKGTLKGTASSATDTITIATSDGDGGTSGGSIAVKINHVPPAITAPSSLKELSGQTVALTGFNVTDKDTISAAGNFTVTLTDKNGVLSATAETGATVTGAGTGKLILAGSLTGIQDELATLTYTGGPTGTKSTLSDTLTINAQDSRNGSSSKTTKITIGHLPPVTTVPGPQKVASGVATAITGVSVADSDPTAGTSTFTETITDKTGLLSATAAAGATVKGAGTAKLTLTGSLAAINQELTSLTYNGTLAKGKTSATDTITISTNDGHGDSDKHTIAVTITPTGNALPNLALFTQYVAAGFAETRAGLGALPAFTPPMAHYPELAAHH
jgi:hypothetical protein